MLLAGMQGESYICRKWGPLSRLGILELELCPQLGIKLIGGVPSAFAFSLWPGMRASDLCFFDAKSPMQNAFSSLAPPHHVFQWTPPVRSFQPNRYGLYDMGGNGWPWVNAFCSPNSKSKVVRGASWYNSAIKRSLLLSFRVAEARGSSKETYGFRRVAAADPKR